MKKIMMTKYGFVKWPEESFSDDGSRFEAYRVGTRVRVTKCVADGKAYISGRIIDGKLPYEVYSNLPHYLMLDELNGVPTADITEEDLQELYEACQAYEVEYTNAENSIQYPTLEEIQDMALKVTAKSVCEVAAIESLMAKYAVEAAVKFSPCEWKQAQEYLKNLIADTKRYNPETYPQTIVGTAHSFSFVKPEFNMEESYWSKSLKKLFNKYGLN